MNEGRVAWQTLHGLLLDSAERLPHALAYVKGAEELTYEELALRAGRIARFLREQGLGAGDRVALVLDGCAEYLTGYYGVLMAGCTVVPLNPDTRPRALAQGVGHCGAKAIIIVGANVGYLQQAEAALPALHFALAVGPVRGGLTRVRLIDLADAHAGGPPLHDGGGTPGGLASINYTSGTTGPPKGVMLAHRNLVANTRSIVEYLRLTHEDRTAMVLPYYYVYGTSVLNTHMAVGGTVVHAGSMAFPVRVLDEIEARGCTGLSGVPSTFAALLRVTEVDRFDLTKVRYVTQAGAAMTSSLTAKLREAFAGAEIFVMYGQTEASARLSFLPPAELDRKMGSAGIGIPGVTLRIVDKDGAEVTRGVVGEIVAEGENVMLGYLDDPEATARVLRNGVLHTGDMAYMDEDGYIFIAGRRTEMIKSGGHRIGPQEIEDVIAAMPGVDECAVVGVPDEMMGEAIVASVVLSEGVELDEQDIKRACFAELPRYKMPTEIHFVGELPRSDRGKLLRSVIREQLESERA